ncbi:amino acid adenylation domain-containing protein [Actinacidiphila yanglinensis]|uniref:Amino acid adenylation domain-containing protein n=1 Tax=Actinacidiphila yanglinensis TaxID=310779 RepID=A0A1H6DIG7_9ACTN|nr:non-ribosomal peptide synthetase [Actinacidiphila yanglinensis]SEG84475.1 amino acid adenylation domain-containing protein [Actinacidiphila yanglinensis]
MRSRSAAPAPAAASSLPATPAQRRMLRLSGGRLDDACLWAHRTLRLHGTPDRTALQRAIEQVADRHDALRCAFTVDEGGTLRQHLGAAPAPRLSPDADRASERLLDGGDAPHVIPDDRCEGTSPTRVAQPLWIRLRDLGAGDHLLEVAAHRLACDEWSLTLLLAELGERYGAALPGREAARSRPATGYAEALRQQSAALAGLTGGHLTFWSQRLADLPHGTALDTPDGPSTDAGAVLLTRALDPAVSAELSRVAAVCGATDHMLLIAVAQLVLSRRTGTSDVMVGAAATGRRPGWQRTIGAFATTVAVRTDLSGTPGFAALVSRVRDAVVDAYRYQDLSYDTSPADIGAAPGAGVGVDPGDPADAFGERSPALTADLVVEPPLLATPPQRWGDLVAEPATPGPPPDPASRAVLRTVTGPGGWRLLLSGRADRIAEDDAAAFLAQLDHVLRQVAETPGRIADAISLLPAEHRAVLPDPRAPLPEPPATRDLVSMVAGQVSRNPGAPAVEHAGRVWSYRELWQRSEHLRSALATTGVEPGHVVAVRGSGFGMVAAMLAVLRAGAVLMPMGSAAPMRRQAALLDAGRPALVLCADDEEVPPRCRVPVLRVDPATGLGSAGSETGAHRVPPPPEVSADDSAYLCFTSGTTGEPQPVVGTHKGLGHFLGWQRDTFGVGPADRAAQFTDASFDVFLRDVFCPLVSGATLCVPDRPGGRLPDDPLGWLAGQRVTLAHLVPTVTAAWLAERSGGPDSTCLRTAFFAGEPLSDALVRDFRSAFPAAEVVNLYGPTETTLATCWHRVTFPPRPGTQPVGRPFPGAQVMVLGPQDRECGVGEIGEIVIRTPYRTRVPEGTADDRAPRFIPNPHTGDPADPVHRTGDRGRFRADGTLTVLGRVDDQVKIRGVRIDPREVAAVIQRHDAVSACVVLPSTGAGQPVLTAHAVRADPSLTVSDLLNHVSSRLPAAMVPAQIHFHSRLPVTRSGKLDRRWLREHAADRAPTGTAAAPRASGEARSVAEARIAAIWQDLLPVDQVERQDSFFHLGGHSMLAMRMIGEVSDAFDVDVPLHAFFDEPTIAGLVRVLSAAVAGPIDPSNQPGG